MFSFKGDGEIRKILKQNIYLLGIWDDFVKHKHMSIIRKDFTVWQNKIENLFQYKTKTNRFYWFFLFFN